MTERRDPPSSNVRDARLPALGLDALVAAVESLPARTPVGHRPRIAPPSLRISDLDPLQIDVFAAMIATLPARGPERGRVLPFPKGGRHG